MDFDRLCKKMVVVCAKRLYLYSLHTGEEITIKENPVSNKGTPCVFRACRYGRGATYGYLFIVINQVDKRRSFIAKLNANSLDRELLRVAHSSRPITTFSISDDGRWLAFASSDFGISLMNAESLQVISCKFFLLSTFCPKQVDKVNPSSTSIPHYQFDLFTRFHHVDQWISRCHLWNNELYH